jgi:8-oxo-dGTP pyrophosphatase MutT (NUDIX family)
MSFGITNENVTNSTCYKKFVESVKGTDMEIQELSVRDSVLKGKFNWLEGKVLNKMSGKVNPTFMLLRGGAVAILVLVSHRGKDYFLVTEQLRAPTGGIQLEAIAGMTDDQGNPFGVAVQELDEEAGIKVTAADLTKLGSYYSSQGIMDEEITCFFMRKEMNDTEIEELTSKLRSADEFEAIRIKMIPATWPSALATRDAKLISSYAMYLSHLEETKVSRPSFAATQLNSYQLAHLAAMTGATSDNKFPPSKNDLGLDQFESLGGK